MNEMKKCMNLRLDVNEVSLLGCKIVEVNKLLTNHLINMNIDLKLNEEIKDNPNF